jgi:hypothetical protein
VAQEKPIDSEFMQPLALYEEPKEVVRSPDGKFLPGKSGNPAGRPKGTKNRIKQLKEDMELVLREGVNPDALKGILVSLVAEAQTGNVQAAKLILDKFMTNAKVEEERGEDTPEIVISIKNLTRDEISVTGEVIDQEESHGEQE